MEFQPLLTTPLVEKNAQTAPSVDKAELILNCKLYSLTRRPTSVSLALDPLLVLIEYVPFGDLLGYLRKSRGLHDTYYKDPDVKPQTNLTVEQLMRFAWQTADGMCYLSSKKVSPTLSHTPCGSQQLSKTF